MRPVVDAEVLDAGTRNVGSNGSRLRQQLVQLGALVARPDPDEGLVVSDREEDDVDGRSSKGVEDELSVLRGPQGAGNDDPFHAEGREVVDDSGQIAAQELPKLLGCKTRADPTEPVEIDRGGANAQNFHLVLHLHRRCRLARPELSRHHQRAHGPRLGDPRRRRRSRQPADALSHVVGDAYRLMWQVCRVREGAMSTGRDPFRRGLTRLRISRYEAREERSADRDFDDEQRVDLAKKGIKRELRRGFGGWSLGIARARGDF